MELHRSGGPDFVFSSRDPHSAMLDYPGVDMDISVLLPVLPYIILPFVACHVCYITNNKKGKNK